MYLRVSITDRCNLRCVYCLSEQARFAAMHERATAGELRTLVEQIHQSLPGGLHKIRITGGEPTLETTELPQFVRHARTLVPHVGLTTNGVLLADLLPALVDAGLNLINISLDAADARGFARFSRRDRHAEVLAAIRAAKRSGLNPVKVNAVAMRSGDVVDMAKLAAWEGVHLRYIELMQIGEAKAFWQQEYLSATEIRTRLFDAGISLVERSELDQPTARVWVPPGTDPREHSIGFITTTSAPFCATCDRLRLSSKGRLFTCLMDNEGVDLLQPLRAGDIAQVHARVRAAVATKKPPAEFVRHEVMAAIGG